MARIAAVADVYDAVTSERVYSPATPAHVGVQMILDGADVAVRPVHRRGLLPARRAVPAWRRGRRSSDGRHGIVVSVPDKELDRPVVRVIDGPGAPYEVSLAKDRSLASRAGSDDGDPRGGVVRWRGGLKQEARRRRLNG